MFPNVGDNCESEQDPANNPCLKKAGGLDSGAACFNDGVCHPAKSAGSNVWDTAVCICALSGLQCWGGLSCELPVDELCPEGTNSCLVRKKAVKAVCSEDPPCVPAFDSEPPFCLPPSLAADAKQFTEEEIAGMEADLAAEDGFDACAGLFDPADCDMLDASQCGTVVFGRLEVSVECPVLCDNCETSGNANLNVDDDAACASSGDSGGKNGGAVVGIVILLLLLAAAVAFIYVTRVGNAKEKDTAGGSSVPAAFENPMYDEPVQSHNSSMAAMMDDLHTKGLNDNALDERSVQSTQSLVSTDETHNESSYLAVESTANSASVVLVDESLAGGSAEEALDGFGYADGGIDL